MINCISKEGYDENCTFRIKEELNKDHDERQQNKEASRKAMTKDYTFEIKETLKKGYDEIVLLESMESSRKAMTKIMLLESTKSSRKAMTKNYTFKIQGVFKGYYN